MRRLKPTPDLRIFYALLVGVGALIAHLASEFAAMGSGADDVLFSPRHAYLGVATIAGIAIFIVRWRAVSRDSTSFRDLKRMLHVGLESLPMRGRGPVFMMLTAALQFGFGMLTEFGEGAPIAGHDVAAGVFGASLVAILIALVVKAAARRLPDIVEAIVRYAPAPSGDRGAIADRRRQDAPVIRRAEWTPQLFNRPPPFRLATAS
jgi:hypothetical protein